MAILHLKYLPPQNRGILPLSKLISLKAFNTTSSCIEDRPLANLPLLDAEEEYEYDEYHEHYKDIDINDHYMIIRNIKKCKAMDKELRKLIEQFHFYLRQMAATGFRYRDVPLKLTLMNGLVYDCEYEVEAMIMTLKKKKLPEGMGMVKFKTTLIEARKGKKCKATKNTSWSHKQT
ncbi:hypothetical protein RB195_007552 [Necator americanus]|uniref:Uncharacterized protein n=1 Tax=Necator americanus TaxID=51031 RepID=A0ABR1C0H5_NECAM